MPQMRAMTVHLTKSRLAALVLVLTLTLLALAAGETIRGLVLVVRAADIGGPARAVADLGASPIREYQIDFPVAGTTTRATVYAPMGSARHTTVVVPGLTRAASATTDS